MKWVVGCCFFILSLVGTNAVTFGAEHPDARRTSINSITFYQEPGSRSLHLGNALLLRHLDLGRFLHTLAGHPQSAPRSMPLIRKALDYFWEHLPLVISLATLLRVAIPSRLGLI